VTINPYPQTGEASLSVPRHPSLPPTSEAPTWLRLIKMPAFDESHSRQDGCHLWTQEPASSPVLPSRARRILPSAQTRDQHECYLSNTFFSALLFFKFTSIFIQHCYFSNWLPINTTEIWKRPTDYPFSFLPFISWWTRSFRQQRRGKRLKQKNTIVQILTEGQLAPASAWRLRPLTSTLRGARQCQGLHPSPADPSRSLFFQQQGWDWAE